MFSVPEQLSTATKANFDSQLAIMNAFVKKAFEGMEKLVELNMTVVKTSIEESSSNAQQLMAAKDPQEFFNMSAAQVQPTAEKALSYGRHLTNIMNSTQVELARATEKQISESNIKVMALIEEVTKNAPAGSQNVVALVKTAIGNANASYEQLTKTTKQAVETMEANMSSAVNQITQATAKDYPRNVVKK